MIGRRVAGIASLGEAFIGLIELALIAELDRVIEEREGLGDGSVDQVRHRQALEARNRLGDDRKALPELLEHVAGERPVFRFSRQPKLGVTRLDEHAHEGGHLRIERRRLGVRVSKRALSSSASDHMAAVAKNVNAATSVTATTRPRMTFILLEVYSLGRDAACPLCQRDQPSPPSFLDAL